MEMTSEKCLAYVKDTAGIVGEVMLWNNEAEITRWMEAMVKRAVADKNDYQLAVLRDNKIVLVDLDVNRDDDTITTYGSRCLEFGPLIDSATSVEK